MHGCGVSGGRLAHCRVVGLQTRNLCSRKKSRRSSQESTRRSELWNCRRRRRLVGSPAGSKAVIAFPFGKRRI
jgi:hypothetical protein